MLDLSAVDLGALAEALEDHSDFIQWYIEPQTGAVVAWSDDLDEPSPADSGALFIEALPSYEAYADMREFVAQVPERRAADLLARAIEGRGAFRRFKDTLFEFPNLRQSWFAFHDVRMRRRAVEWLESVGLVDDATAGAALAALVDAPVGPGVADPWDVASRLAADLRGVFGKRLTDVVVFGSHAEGTANDDSDLDVAVVLRDLGSPWEQSRAIDDILWRHTIESGITVSALLVDAKDWERPERPLLRTVKSTGQSVT